MEAHSEDNMDVKVEISNALNNLRNDKISRFNNTINDVIQHKATTLLQSKQKEVAKKIYGN